MDKQGMPLFNFPQNDHQEHSPKDTASPTSEHVGRSDENVERGNWSSKTEYLLSMIGCAVGLSNVWRFPYLAYRNGGGAFLIPYALMLAFIGMPMFFLETSFGQFASLGPIAVWKAVPMLQGVGITMVLFSTIIDIVYNCIITYSLFYLFASFQSPLPWADCFSWWGADETCSRTPRGTVPASVGKSVLQHTSSVNETGKVVWPLALCLLLAWLIVCGALSKGIKSSGKVVYFTATFPYVVLTLLLIRGVTLEGAYKGIEFYIGRESDFSKLADAEVWKDAATQIFYSLAIGWGSLITLSSYNKFHNNCYRDTILVCVINCATSVFAGFVIFSILGHMAHIQDKPVSKVAQSGFGLAFIVYPEALAQLPWAPLWSILFFFMLITLGLSSQCVAVEAVITTLLDQFPGFLRPRRLFLTAVVCLSFYFLSLTCVTQAGIYWINLIDHFCAGWGVLLTASLELISISWLYGLNRFIKDIEMMIGERSWHFWLWWRVCWCLISPCLMAAIIVWSLITFTSPTYGTVEYPIWAMALGWCMVVFCIMWIPIIAMKKIAQSEGSGLWQTVTEGCVGKRGKTVERISWSSKTDYLLSVIGFSVGLGNVWRFPYLAYKNGGGVFFIPYTLMLAVAGMPMFFLESALGQFASRGCINIWKAIPMLQGVGITMVIVVTFFNISYCCIIAYSLFYLFASFQSPLPWADCFRWWGADETCSRTPRDPLCNLTLESRHPEIVNRTWLLANNKTCSNGSEIHVHHQGPSEQYWDKVALQRSRSMDEMGEIVWHLALCLLLAWLLVVAALSKGIKSSGKVVYFTAVFPYVVLTVLLIQGLTLQGASKGIEFFIGSQSDISKLADTEVWKDAATQIFYSLAVGWGCLLTFSSYNKFHNNCFRDTITVCVVNCGTSVLAGFVIFSVLGHMAHVQDKPISKVVQSGFSLAFIAYPEALAQLPWAPLWSTLFFLMLLTLGFDTQLAALEMIITILVDQFPHLLQSKRIYLTAGLSLVFYFLGLVFVTKAGIYWINLIDYFCTGWILITIALMELIGLSWIYGVSRFIKDIEMMIGERNRLFWLWWRVCWCLITPCLLMAILTWSLATFSPPTYGSVEYPGWAIVLGWCMIILCIIWIPIIAVMRVAQAEGSTLYQKISAACSSAPDWGPYLEQHRGERYKTKLYSSEGPHQVHLLPTEKGTYKETSVEFVSNDLEDLCL